MPYLTNTQKQQIMDKIEEELDILYLGDSEPVEELQKEIGRLNSVINMKNAHITNLEEKIYQINKRFGVL